MASEFDIDAVTRNAVSLGITLTEANEGTGVYEQWSARVMQAQMHLERGEQDLCKAMVDETNRLFPSREPATGKVIGTKMSL